MKIYILVKLNTIKQINTNSGTKDSEYPTGYLFFYQENEIDKT